MATAESLNKVLEMFKRLDANGDGRLTAQELKANMPNKGNEELVTLINIYDKDGNGGIDIIEFAQMLNAFPLRSEEDKNKKLVPTKDQEESVMKLFRVLDDNGNGYVNQDEFIEHLVTQGVPLGRQSSKQLFRIIQSKGTQDDYNPDGITYQNLLNYVVEEDFNAQDEERINYSAINNVEGLLRAAAIDGLEIDLTTLAEYMDDADKNVELREVVADILNKQANEKTSADLKSAEDKKWKPFINFRRRGEKKTIMFSPNKIQRDVLPGRYELSNLVTFDDLPPIEPEHVVIKGAAWKSSGENGKRGKLVLPNSFDGKIPVDIATNETLSYYGASIAEGKNSTIKVSRNEVIMDFTYSENYYKEWVMDKLGGPALEFHEFHHLDTNISSDPGYWVVAKWADEDETELHVTAFIVPIRHTVYTPGGVIHTNSFLKGTWRTMLSDGDINEAALVRKDGSIPNIKIG